MRRSFSGQRVFEQRKKMHIKQIDLADKSSVSPALLSLWERGEREPSDRTALRVSDALGIEFETLRKDLERDRRERKESKEEMAYREKLIAAIAKAAGQGIASSLVAGAIERTAGNLSDLRRSELEKKIAQASENAFWEFVAAFPKGEFLSETAILERYFKSATLKEEVGKILFSDDEIPNLRVLHEAFLDAGYTDDMLPSFDFNSAMTAFIGEFRKELGDLIELTHAAGKAEMGLYLQQVAEAYGRLDFVGIPDPRDKRELRLDDVFVTLRAREQSAEADMLQMEEKEPEDPRYLNSGRRTRNGIPAPAGASVKLNDALKDNQKLVILGGPGAGKTTMLRYVGLTLAQGKAEEKLGLPDGLIPIFVELSKFADRDDQQQSLEDFIYDYVKISLNVLLPPSFFETFLEQGRCVLLLDGLDEVGTLAQRVEVKNIVSSFASRYKGNRFVFTSRIAGYNEASVGRDFAHFTVCDFTSDDTRQFARKWYVAREGDTEIARTKADDLVKAISGNSRVAMLARNPLMLTIIALVHRVEAELPNQRIKLYDKCTESLLYTWEAVKKRGEKPMSEAEKRRRLEWIAYWMQTMPGSGGQEQTVVRRALQRKLTGLLVEKGRTGDMDEAEAEAKLFLDQIRKRTGILMEQSRGIYSFAHLTFQEYFAGCDIHRRLLAAAMSATVDSFWKQELEPRLHNPRWQEVILLLLGKLSNESDEAASELVKRIKNVGSQYEDILYRDLILAGRCLADDVAVGGPLRKKILDGLFHLFRYGKYTSLRNAARDILVGMGGSRYRDSVVRGFIEALSDEDGGIRSRAIEALYQLGTGSNDAKDVIGALAEALDAEDSEIRGRAAVALDQLRTASTNITHALIETLGDEDNRIRPRAIVDLDDEDSDIRARAVAALDYLEIRSNDVIDALTEALNGKYSDVRSGAALALGKLGVASGDVIDGLMKALGDEDGLVRSSAAKALGELGVASGDVMDALMKALGDEDRLIRSSAAKALGELGVASGDMIDALMKALGDEDRLVRSSAAEALGELGSESGDVIDVLMKALGDEDSLIRSSAAKALGELGVASGDVMDALMKALGDEQWTVRSSVAGALGKLGVASGDVIDALMKALSDKDGPVGSSAAGALGKLGVASGDVIDALMKALGDEDSYVRSSAAKALGELGSKSGDVMDALMKALNDEGSNVGLRYGAVSVLGNLGTTSEDVIDALIKSLGDEEWQVRYSAASALGRLGGGSAEAMRALLDKLDSEADPHTANSIFDAISTLAAAEAAGQTQDARHETQDQKTI